MATSDEFSCQLGDKIAPEFHDQVRENCQRCQTGQGRCLIEFMMKVATKEPNEPKKP